MDKRQLMQYVAEQYSADPEYPWEKYPKYAVFRHKNNRKWFALFMTIPKYKLGLAGDELIDVLNVKCDPVLVGSLQSERGLYPAYHMSKTNWISITLDDSLADDKIKWLLDLSYELTAVKNKRKSNAL